MRVLGLKSIWLLVLAIMFSPLAMAESKSIDLTERVCAATSAEIATIEDAWSSPLSFDCSQDAMHRATDTLWVYLGLNDIHEPMTHLIFTPSRQGSITLHVRDNSGHVTRQAFSPSDLAQHWSLFDTLALPLPQRASNAQALVIQIEEPWDPANWGSIHLGEDPRRASDFFRNLILAAAFCGLLTAPLFLNFVFTFVLQNRFVLLHSIMMLCVLTYAISWSGLIFPLVPGLDTVERSILNYLIIPTAFFAAACLVFELCEADVLEKRWRLWLAVSGALPLFISWAVILNAPAWPLYASQVYHASFFIPLATIAAALAIAIDRGSHMARLQLIGWSGLLLLVLSRIAVGIGLISHSPLSDIGFFPVLIFEVAMSSIAVSYRLIALRKDRDRAQQRHQEMTDLAGTDYLTGIPNRRAFEDNFTTLLERRHKRRQASALLLLDLDHFKALNDTYGHDVGDAVLCEFATLINREKRYEDFCARIGGEEFAILVHAQSADGTVRCAERICEAIADHIFCKSSAETIKQTASIGLAHIDLNAGKHFENYYRVADAALYRAKSFGRNCVIVANETAYETDAEPERSYESRSA